MIDSIGVVVGRFQVDALHPGHIGLLRHAAENHSKLIIFVGVRPTPANATNPLPFSTIEAMIREEHPDATVIPIQDVGPSERANVQWSKNLDNMISIIAGSLPVTLYTGRDGFNKSYRGRYLIETVDLDDTSNATNIRATIGAQVENSRSWRRGVIWAHQNKQYHEYYTVDMACCRLTLDGRVEVLLARKPDETEWRFPGGFVEPHELFHVAAGREFHEETDLYTVDGFRIIRDFVIDDWRTRNQKGVGNKTVLCIGWYMSGTAKAKDDIAEVKWFDIIEVVKNAETLVVKEHRQEMVAALFEHLEEKGIPARILAENQFVRENLAKFDKQYNR